MPSIAAWGANYSEPSPPPDYTPVKRPAANGRPASGPPRLAEVGARLDRLR